MCPRSPATVGYVVLLAAMGVCAKLLGIETTTMMGIPSIETGVFGGIIVGLIAAAAFNRFYRIELPSYLGFFAGKRSVPIITAFAVIVVGARAQRGLAADRARRSKRSLIGRWTCDRRWPSRSTAWSSAR